MHKSSKNDLDDLLTDPVEAADQIDAILYFIHRRYNGNTLRDVPQINGFLIYKLDIIFDDVERITLVRKYEKNSLDVIAPRVSSDKEEDRRIDLHNKYGTLLLKFQTEAVTEVRKMLVRILDEDGRKKLVKELNDYKRQNKKNSHS